MDNPPQSGRPVEADSDQIKTLIETSQQYTMWEITNILKISKSVKLLVKKKCVFYFRNKNIWTFQPTCYIGLPLCQEQPRSREIQTLLSGSLLYKGRERQ